VRRFRKAVFLRFRNLGFERCRHIQL
jgi:hypothetical protein